MTTTAHVGVTGLAVMGRNLARNLARNGYTVAVHNRTPARTNALVEQFGDEGTFVPAKSAKELVASLQRPRRLIIMVQAGDPTEAVIDELAPLLDPGDVLVDGGNAHFTDTRRREAALRARGIHFAGVGISGGEEGALHGPSIMPGGSKEAYQLLSPLLDDIAATAPDGARTVAHLGPDGAGHFVKMVHNGIEYADMQLITEAYHLLRHTSGYEPSQIAEIFRTWNTGRLNSYLIEVTAEVFAHTDPSTGLPFVDIVADRAGQKGTGRWTVQTALDLGTPVSGIAQAVFARSLSSQDTLREAGRTLPGPTRRVLGSQDAARFADQVEQALYAAKVVSYDQGFHQIRTASDTYQWDVDLATVAALWRAGCIIRADFLDRIGDAYTAEPRLTSLLRDPHFAEEIGQAQWAWRAVAATAARDGVPAPGMSAALAHFDTLRTERLPAALIQGQRDYFGAHTYQRTDQDGSFHTDWAGDRTEHRTR
ncbi:NADP-dependent phosphogluconate dehydrogenase [Streptomyces mirabilis]|uniref:NADP-dependent phosphogluconate dehydrogenase n=1 Tax=Streptomyces mirabilis TaxID=68239 RepID=UPI0036DA4ABA